MESWARQGAGKYAHGGDGEHGVGRREIVRAVWKVPKEVLGAAPCILDVSSDGPT